MVASSGIFFLGENSYTFCPLKPVFRWFKVCTMFPATSAWMVALDRTFEPSLPWTVLHTFIMACIRFGVVHRQAILRWSLMAMPIWGLARESLCILLLLTKASDITSNLKAVSQLTTLDEVVTLCILVEKKRQKNPCSKFRPFSQKKSWQLRKHQYCEFIRCSHFHSFPKGNFDFSGLGWCYLFWEESHGSSEPDIVKDTSLSWSKHIFPNPSTTPPKNWWTGTVAEELADTATKCQETPRPISHKQKLKQYNKTCHYHHKDPDSKNPTTKIQATQTRPSWTIHSIHLIIQKV